MSALPPELQARVERYARPVSEQTPAGEPARYVPAYEGVTVEVGKLDSPSSGSVAWPEVLREAGKLLEEKTKDLSLAAYLGYALYATEGLSGAAVGAGLLADLMERYWPSLFPEAARVKARASAVAWFVDRLAQTLPSRLEDPADREALVALDASTRRLSELSRMYLGQHAPAFKRLGEGLQRLLADAIPPQIAPTTPVPAPPPASASGLLAASELSATKALPAKPPAASEPDASSLPPLEELRDLGAVVDFLRNTGNALVSAAGALRRANNADPTPYRLLRTALWLHLRQAPAPGANQRTSVPPLNSVTRRRIEHLLQNERWIEALEESECALAHFRFAFDLHRYSAQALTRLGDTHADARTTVVHETLVLVERMPHLPELLASDGSPLADAGTLAWLAGLRPTARKAGRGTVAPAPQILPLSESTRPPIPPPDASGSGSLHDTLTRLQDTASGARSGRERFLARLQMADHCVRAGKLTLAEEIYAILEEDTATLALDDWEPALASALLLGSIRLKSSTHTGEDHLRERRKNQLRRIVKLDLASALALEDDS